MRTAIAKVNRFFKDVPIGVVFSSKGSYYLKVDKDNERPQGYMVKKRNAVSIATGRHDDFEESDVVAIHPDATLVIDYHAEGEEET